jgi:hypothetical protein
MGSPKTPEEPLAYHEDKLDWERMSYCVTQELREPRIARTSARRPCTFLILRMFPPCLSASFPTLVQPP